MNKPALKFFLAASLLASFAPPCRAVLAPEQLKQTIARAQAGDQDAQQALQSELLYYQMLQGSPGMMTNDEAKNLKLIKAALTPAGGPSALPPEPAPPARPAAPAARGAALGSPIPNLPAAASPHAPPPEAAAVGGDSAAQAPEDLVSRGEGLSRRACDEARRQFEQAYAVLDLGPRLVLCLECLGRLAVARHDIATARVLFNKAVASADKIGRKKAPGVAEAYLGLGLCQIHDGDKAKAVKTLRKGLKSGPDDEARGNLQRALEQAQRRRD